MRPVAKYRARLIIISIISLSALVSACVKTDSGNTSSTHTYSLSVTVPKPTVKRDLDQIKKSGVIRLITRYNSSSYFLDKGIERGFEYEFFKHFAKEEGLSVEVVIIKDGQNPIDMLNSGEGDVIAANYVKTPKRKKYIDFSRPYNLVNQVIVLPENKYADDPPDSLSQLGDIKISVRKNSSYYQTLRELKNEGYPFKINAVSEGWDTEALILNVAQNEMNATVSDNNLYHAAHNYINGVVAGPVISKSDTVAWGIRKNSPELKKAMNNYLAQHFKIKGPDQPPLRSEFLNVLRNRYFKDRNQINAFRRPMHSQYSGLLSPYDKLIKPIADSMGVDWKMVVAIAAQESKFDPTAESWTGAVGLMQVLPDFSSYSKEQLMNTKINIHEGIRIISQQLKHYSYLDSTDQWEFALATYNAGPGHIGDARRLVIDQAKNPNKWKDVSKALIMLMKRKYYKDARYGFCRGIETVSYVNDIMRRYRMYNTIETLADRNGSAPVPSLLGYSHPINMP